MSNSVLQPILAGGKTDQVTEMLAQLARVLGTGAKLPTIRELCKKTQVSLPTLTAALDRLEIRGILHRKHGSGIYVSALARTRRIGMLMNREELFEDAQSHGGFYRILMGSLRKQAEAREAALVSYTYDAEHDPEKLGPQQFELDVRNGRADAIISAGLKREQMDQVLALGMPCVFFTVDDTYTPRIALKFDSIIEKGVEALSQRGCRRIGFAYPAYPDGRAYRDYVRVFQRALREMGVSDGFSWQMPFDLYRPRFRSLEASHQFYRMWTRRSERPDGLLSTDDQCTSGILHAMALLGLRSPGDLRVASHANKGLELFGENAVIRFEFDPAEIGGTLLQASEDLLSGREVPAEQIIKPQVRWPEE